MLTIFDTVSSAYYAEFMEYQRARTKEQIADRQAEIIAACDAIYREKGYEAVHFKAVSQMTSISRSSIYNYYKTKEEIFLDVLIQDYIRWKKELLSHYKRTPRMKKNQYCLFITKSLKKHEKYLELITVYLYQIEKNSSLEKLISFKAEIHQFLGSIQAGLSKYFPGITNRQKQKFVFYLMVIVTGAYAHTHMTEKQIQAAKYADPEGKTPDFHQVCYEGLLMLLSDV